MYKILSVIVLSVLLIGCGSGEAQRAEALQNSVMDAHSRIKQLQNQLDNNLIKNALLLKSYAATVKSLKPELSEITTALAKDATPAGPTFLSLQARLRDAEQQVTAAAADPQRFKQLDQELNNIRAGADIGLYGMMLSDPINVLADMSDGVLARVESMGRDAALQTNKKDSVGEQLVGNPNYGNWQTGSNGQSFWAWYGQYAMLSSLLNMNRPMYYGDWAGNRGYSHYHDRGRGAYTSPKQRQAQDKVEKRTRNKFSQSGKKFNSPYAKSNSKRNMSSSSRRSSSSSSSRTRSSKSAFNSSYRSRSYGSYSRGWGGK